jgi:hypothetical protein
MSTPSSRSLSSILLLGAALFLAAADGDGCTIVLGGGGGGGGDDDDDQPECPDRERLCPNLSCPDGFAVDDDGCEICECAAAGCDARAAGPAPECAGARFDERSCSWTCEPIGCRADTDCGPGAACVDGQCFGVAGCFSDFDCGPGFFCDAPSSTGDAPPPPDGGGAEPVPAPGVCQPLAQCVVDDDCGPGARCEAFADPSGRVAPGRVCVRDGSGASCLVDDECAPGERCQLGCEGSCPECDDCVRVTGTCAIAAAPCDAFTPCRPGEICQPSDPAARPCLDANNDGRCDDSADPVPPPPDSGFCVPAPLPACTVDADCRPGQTCKFEECNCAAVCTPDGRGGCLPCECPVPEGEPVGVCIDPPPPAGCFDDSGCANGEFCDLSGGAAAPCDPTSTNCDALVVAPSGVCRPADACGNRCDDLSICHVDANGSASCIPNPCHTIRCSANHHCEVATDGTGFCAADPGECTSDQDCASDLVCNAIDVCLQPPSCTSGGPCIDVCYGYCVAP